MNLQTIGAAVGSAKGGGIKPAVVPLRFTNTGESSSSITYLNIGNTNLLVGKKGKFETWNGSEITLQAGDYIEVIGVNTSAMSGYTKGFSINGNIAVSGDIMSIWDYTQVITTIPINNIFARLFKECNGLVDAKDLILSPSVLKVSTYDSMFISCVNLRTAPELLATTLEMNSYASMFYGCTSLIKAPTVLPALHIPTSAYSLMFMNCSSLQTAPEISATTLDQTACSSMFSGCTALTTPPSVLSAETLVRECYASMFTNCSSLQESPIISAKNLPQSSDCCSQMFSGCASLNKVTCLATTIGTYATGNWLYGVSATGTFIKDASADWSSLPAGMGIPSGWTAQDA